MHQEQENHARQHGMINPYQEDIKVIVFINLVREHVQDYINLGFSGSGLGEIELAKIATSIDDVNLLILDYEANGGATGDMKSNLEPFIDTFILLFLFFQYNKIKTAIGVYEKFSFLCIQIKRQYK